MAICLQTISSAIKSQLLKRRINKRNKYARLERSPSEEELDNSANESLEQKIREGMRNGSVVLILPPPVCRHCQAKIVS